LKILLVNSFYYLRGGSERYTLNLAELLRGAGHEVLFFSMAHPENPSSPESKYFVEHIDFDSSWSEISPKRAFQVIWRGLYSLQSRRNIRGLLEDHSIDLAHLQNIHAHITPAIISDLKKRGIPVLWTLHDYKILCPNTHFLSHGRVCEACRGRFFFHCTMKRCKKDSLFPSLLVTMEAYIHKVMRLIPHVDRFISPSRFLRDKFVQYGFPKSRVIHIRNSLRNDLGGPELSDDNYVLYFGQLRPWKGVLTLLKAAELLRNTEFRIVGDGPQMPELQAYAMETKLENVKFLGYKSGTDLTTLLNRASLVAMPSEWYENCPYSIMEAQEFGKPIVGARIGGIPELVRDGETGLCFTPGDPNDLASKIKRLMESSELRKEMGRKARSFAREEYDQKRHLSSVLDAYSSVREQP
jgi:glycosyltransferase involved in cell wall biosynthesis